MAIDDVHGEIAAEPSVEMRRERLDGACQAEAQLVD